jgi:hypothetical protein
MVDKQPITVEDYVLVLRVIQPARVQDIKRMYPEIMGVTSDAEKNRNVEEIHALMRRTGRVTQVRRGTYVLTHTGMEAAGRLVKPRSIDNARLFLMKSQRRVYR